MGAQPKFSRKHSTGTEIGAKFWLGLDPPNLPSAHRDSPSQTELGLIVVLGGGAICIPTAGVYTALTFIVVLENPSL